MEDGTRPYPAHDLAPELDDLSIAYAQLEAELARVTAELEAAQGQLDTARHIPLGRYAFYHRHLAMGYVRRRDPELANWASVEAGHQIRIEGGRSFEDVVGRLEAALRTIAAGNPGSPKWLTDVEMADIARAALKS